MSGHSKWSKIKRKKGSADQKKGNLFSKTARLVAVAARKGGDPALNTELASAIEKARSINMPKGTIERAIKKGTGEDSSAVQIEEFTIEAVGQGGVGFIIECTSDNKRRTLSEVKKILETSGWNMAEVGSVSWQFEKKGLVVVPVVKLREEKTEWAEAKEKGEEVLPLLADELENFELAMIEIDGVLDVRRDTEDDLVEVLTEPKKVGAVAKQISSELGHMVDCFEIIRIPKTPLKVDDKVNKKVEEITEKLENHDDVQTVWSNAKDLALEDA